MPKLSPYQKTVLDAFATEPGKPLKQKEQEQALYWFCAGWAACLDLEGQKMRSDWYKVIGTPRDSEK